MATERFGLITVGGKDATFIGADVRVGQVAPEFIVHALEWSLVRGLADTKGKVRIIASVPSLDTDVCDRDDKVVYVAYMPTSAMSRITRKSLERRKRRWKDSVRRDALPPHEELVSCLQ